MSVSEQPSSQSGAHIYGPSGEFLAHSSHRQEADPAEAFHLSDLEAYMVGQLLPAVTEFGRQLRIAKTGAQPDSDNQLPSGE